MSMNKMLDALFKEPISDEAAYMIYHFLEQLTLEVGSRYFCQMMRHIQAQQPLKPTDDDSISLSEEKDEHNF